LRDNIGISFLFHLPLSPPIKGGELIELPSPIPLPFREREFTGQG